MIRKSLLLIIIILLSMVGVGYAASTPPELDESFADGIKVISFINNNSEPKTLEYRKSGDSDWSTGFSLELLPEGENQIDFRYTDSNVVTATIYNENNTVRDLKDRIEAIDVNSLDISNYREREIEIEEVSNEISQIETTEQRQYLSSLLSAKEVELENFIANNDDLAIEGLLANKEVDNLSDIKGIYDEIERLSSNLLLEEIIEEHTSSVHYRKNSLNYLSQKVIEADSSISSVEVYKSGDDERFFIAIHLKNSSPVNSSELWVQNIPKIMGDEVDLIDDLEIEVFGTDLDSKLNITFGSDYFSEGDEGALGLQERVSKLPKIFNYYNFTYRESIGRDITLKMYGDFLEEDIDWESSSFQDFLKLDVAKDLSLSFYKDVDIEVYDKDGELIESESFNRSEFTHDLDIIEDLEDTLDDDFEEHQDMDFDFTLYTDNSTLYLRMEGDFREEDDDWEARSSESFLDYIEDIKDLLLEDIEMTLDIKVMDRDEFLKEDTTDVSQLNFTLNSDYSYYPTEEYQIYYNITNVSDSYLKLTLVLSDWDSRRDHEEDFEDWLYEGPDRYLKNNTQKEISYRIEDEDGNYERSYTLDKNLSLKDYELEREINNTVLKLGDERVDKVRISNTDINIYLDEDYKRINTERVWDSKKVITNIIDKYYSIKFRLRLYDEDRRFIEDQYYTPSKVQGDRLGYLEANFTRFEKDFGGNLSLTKESATDYIEYELNITNKSTIKVSEATYDRLLKDLISTLDIGQVKVKEEDEFKYLVDDFSIMDGEVLNKLLTTDIEATLIYFKLYKEDDDLSVVLNSGDYYSHKIEKELVEKLKLHGIDLNYRVIFEDSKFLLEYNLIELFDELKADESISVRATLGDVYQTEKLPLTKTIVLETYSDQDLVYTRGDALSLEARGLPKVEKGIYEYDYNLGWDLTLPGDEDSKEMEIFIRNSSKHAILGARVAEELQFNDISTSAYRDDILKLAAKGYINGISSTQFNPKGNLTRGQFAKIITKAFYNGELENTTNGTFTDVNKSDWFFPYVEKVVSENLMNGVGSDYFAPNGNVTEEEVLVVLAREMGNTSNNLRGSYLYQNSISSWALDSANKIVESKIINPLEIEPQKTITREKLMHWLVEYERVNNGQ